MCNVIDHSNQDFKASVHKFKLPLYYTMFFNIIFLPMNLSPQMNVRLDSIYRGSEEL